MDLKCVLTEQMATPVSVNLPRASSSEEVSLEVTILDIPDEKNVNLTLIVMSEKLHLQYASTRSSQ